MPSLALVAACLLAGDEPREHSVGSCLEVGAPGAPKLQAGSWYEQARRAIEDREYLPSVTEAGLQAPNRAQGIRTYFLASCLEVVPRTAAQSARRWKWKTFGWGREGQMRNAPEVRPSCKTGRVIYRRGEFTEWYENRREGLEQGFSLARRPPGRGLLRFEGLVDGGLHATIAGRGSSIEFLDDSGRSILKYGGLVARDATGRGLPAELRLSGTTLALEINDAAARYPLEIDPLLTGPGWSVAGGQALGHFGLSVATAGDVNGDGYSDVLVSAPSYDDGHPEAGRVELFLGARTGLSASPAWTASGAQDSASFGASVATAGDVNADGYGDILIGAPRYDAGQIDEGAAFLFLGSSGGLHGTAAWSAQGDQDSSYFGTSVAWAGDVDGDGRADVVVGAPGYSAGEPREGAAFLYNGSGSSLSLGAAWTAESNQADAQFGTSVATAGDVNGDGYADVIVGASGYSNGQAKEGRAYVYVGSATGLVAGSPWTAESDQADAQFGASVATAGDVNGDGYADVVVGASGYSNGQTKEGRVYVYVGSAAGLVVGSPWTAESDQVDAQFGASAATAGDVNGDGYGDVVVGAPGFDGTGANEGRAYAYLGTSSGPSAIAAWTVSNFASSAQFGFSVATAGDVDGDGYSDVIVGAVGYDGGQIDEGAVFLFRGSALGLGATPVWSAESNQAGSLFGNSVSSAGDVNGDGYGDVLMGAPLYTNGQTAEGAAFIYYGSPAGLGPSGTPANADWHIEDDRAGSRLGVRVASAGDVNGDGYADVIIGAYTRGLDVAAPKGRAYVYYGSQAGPASTPWVRDGDQDFAEFGYSVAGAGDVNGDGFSDVLVGARRYSNGEPDEGRVYLYLGSASGLAATHAWFAEGNQDSSEFGYRVDSAGDVNGDGYSDVAIGAPFYDNGQYDEGRVFVYLGSSTGLGPNGTPANADWWAESDQIRAELGAAVAAAGDVNGDGYGDLIVGAPLYDNPENDEGRAFVYFGSNTGLGENGIPANADWSADGGQVGARFGISLACAGDVNGDGVPDLIVGADLYDKSMAVADNGEALVFYGNGAGVDRLPRQARADDTAPLAMLGKSDAPLTFRLKALGRAPAGRDGIRLEWQISPFTLPFDATGFGVESWQDTGTPTPGVGSAVPLNQLISGRASGSAHHWRLRIAALAFPVLSSVPAIADRSPRSAFDSAGNYPAIVPT